jgi:hypothetical protein
MIRRRSFFANRRLPTSGKVPARRSSSGARTLRVALVAGITLLAPLLTATTAAAATQVGWSRVADMAAARQISPAVTLPSGKVLLTDGGTAELYDPASETFSSTGAPTVDRNFGASGTLLRNGKVLFAGGGGLISTAVGSAELYDPATGTFTPTGDMSDRRSGHTATLLADGRVLVTGGSLNGFPEAALASAEIYDPATGTFTPTGSMATPRQEHTATLLRDGRVLITGGYTGDARLGQRTAELYDPATGTFTPTPTNLTTGRGHHTATTLPDGRVLIAGGFTQFPGQGVDSAELYDPATGTFTPTGAMHDLRGWHTATLLNNGTVLVAGGFTAFPFTGQTLASAETYDPGTGTFTLTTSMHAPRGRHAAAKLLNGDVLVAGGLGAEFGGATNTAEVFSLALNDIRPPAITTPADITLNAPAPDGGALVNYAVTVVDNVDDNPQLTCDPPSGSTFPIGVTTVRCTATDSSGNTSAASFTVTVLPPVDVILVVDRAGSVDKKTGVATVSGTISCNQTTTVSVSGTLKQTVANRGQVDGTFFTGIDCTRPGVSWKATVTPDIGRYNAGGADINATAFGCNGDFTSCDRDQVLRSIKLTGR